MSLRHVFSPAWRAYRAELRAMDHKLAEFLAGIPGISVSPVDIKARPSGIAQGYLTLNLERQ